MNYSYNGGRTPRKAKKVESDHYVPTYDVNLMLQYPAKKTGCPLLDLVSRVLFENHYITPKQLADHIAVSRQQLSQTISMLTGYGLAEIVDAFQAAHVRRIIAENPEQSGDQLARLCGYHKRSAMYYFCERMGIELKAE